MNLGYWLNSGRTKEHGLAAATYKASCNEQEQSACNDMGFALLHANKENEAADVFLKSCNGGYATGYFSMGAIWFKKKDYERARIGFSRACKSGVKIRCEMISKNYCGDLTFKGKNNAKINFALEKDVYYQKINCKTNYL